MISIKIGKRDNGSIKSVCTQGHTSAQICAAVSTLMQACGHYLESNKSAIMDIDEREMCLISNIKQTKPAVAVTDTLVDGLESIARQYPFNVQIKYLWEDKEE